MAETKLGKPFGLDAGALSAIDWELSVARILTDLRSDFIFAPHLAFIYANAGERLRDEVIASLKGGKFLAGFPLTIEVPKTFRMRVSATKRLGPSYSRPGSILLPHDRLLYQALGDQAALAITGKEIEQRTFSHRLAAPGSEAMFLPTRTCWTALQEANRAYATDPKSNYIIKLDIANFFGSINLHTLDHVMKDAGYSDSFASRLENLLIGFTGDRSSRGLLQGIFPSDLLGNFYLTPVDRFLEEQDVLSARYVDDIYIFVESVDAAGKILRKLVPYLRSYDLSINEAKSRIMRTSALITEEPDLQKLFDAAVEEISEQLDEEEFDADYGFQSEWDDEEVEDEDLELQATMMLFDSIGEYVGYEENIERFCLPLFARAGSDYALEHVLGSINDRPAMAQIYAGYLVKFIDSPDVAAALVEVLLEPGLFDWQKMWILAALLQADDAEDASVKVAAQIMGDANRHDALRATAAVYIGRFGDHGRRKALAATYVSVSPYVQAAIYFSSRDWPGPERANAKTLWGAQGGLSSLLTEALANA